MRRGKTEKKLVNCSSTFLIVVYTLFLSLSTHFFSLSAADFVYFLSISLPFLRQQKEQFHHFICLFTFQFQFQSQYHFQYLAKWFHFFFFVEKFINLLLYVNSVLGICKFLKILGSSDNAHCTVQLKLCSHARAVPVQLNMCVRCVLATCVGNISQLLQIAISCFHFPRQHMYASAAQTVCPP